MMIASTTLLAVLAISTPTPAGQAENVEPASQSFSDVAADIGLTLLNVSGDSVHDYIVEASGNGAAFMDHDNDGDIDLLITNGSSLESYAEGGDPMVTLYENVGGSFVVVTAEAGLDARGWAMGACVADYDNDGDSDFYVTAYGRNRLFRNGGDGTFTDRTSSAGVGGFVAVREGEGVIEIASPVSR